MDDLPKSSFCLFRRELTTQHKHRRVSQLIGNALKGRPRAYPPLPLTLPPTSSPGVGGQNKQKNLTLSLSYLNVLFI